MNGKTIPSGRGVFCNRTLNLRSIRAIGYDMDYTLVHYRVAAWEQRAYQHCQAKLAALGWRVSDLEFDERMVARGLVMDTETGNLVKANRFGFIKKAVHGTREIPFDEQRRIYNRVIVDLAEPRWVFLNTLFSLSEGCLYAQLVDRFDAGLLPGSMGYRRLYEAVRDNIDRAHLEGKLKSEVQADPAHYVLRDPEVVLALIDQKKSGKKLMLITNSEWAYSNAMMRYCFDPFLTSGKGWRDLFDVIIVGARKPDFFTDHAQLFEVATDDGLLRPGASGILPGRAYFGGSASHVEACLGVTGDDVLYVGDHMFGDVHMSKRVLRWRTALILREIEDEIAAVEGFADSEARIEEGMTRKNSMEAELSWTRLELQRLTAGYGDSGCGAGRAELETRIRELRAKLVDIDAELAPLAKAATELMNPRWGLLMRAGNDKSHLARQVERYADIYTSRVSNFLWATPFVYLRARRGSLPHDPFTPGGPPLTGPLE